MSAIPDGLKINTRFTVHRYEDEARFAAGTPYDVSEFGPNLGLNEGLQAALDLIFGTGSPTAFNAANAYLGVGDSSAAEAATQTDLQASTNKTYKAMASTYPSRSAQTVTLQAVFGSADANYAWNEFTVANPSARSYDFTFF